MRRYTVNTKYWYNIVTNEVKVSKREYQPSDDYRPATYEEVLEQRPYFEDVSYID